MNCIYCKSKMKKGKTALTFQMTDDRIIVVKDVPASICAECGEESIDIKNAKIVERIVEKAIADGIKMGFIEYNNAA
ncbi:MAG: YgiT-type zinc finger protein [Melioribacteraceae bacterium]